MRTQKGWEAQMFSFKRQNTNESSLDSWHDTRNRYSILTTREDRVETVNLLWSDTAYFSGAQKQFSPKSFETPF